jgi:hypothetical protein
MNEQQRLQRLIELMELMDAFLSDLPRTDGMNVDEAFGVYDGLLLTLRETWDEMKTLMIVPPKDTIQ